MADARVDASHLRPSSLTGRYRRLLQLRRWKRLEAAVEREEKLALSLSRKLDSEDRDALEASLRASRLKLMEGELDVGWELLRTARRIKLAAFDEEALAAAALTLRLRAEEALGSWRRLAVLELLGPETESEAERSNKRVGRADFHQRVAVATEIFDGNLSGEEYRASLKRDSVVRLSGVLTVVLLTILVFLPTGFWSAITQFAGDSASMTRLSDAIGWILLGMAVFGVLGSTFSSLSGTRANLSTSAAQEVAHAVSVNIIRILSGPAAAVVVGLVILSDLYSLVFNFDRPNGLGLLVIAFAAGFSERLVRKVVETVSGGEDSDRQPE